MNLIEASQKHFEHEMRVYRARHGRDAQVAVATGRYGTLVRLEDDGRQVSFRAYKAVPVADGWHFMKA